MASKNLTSYEVKPEEEGMTLSAFLKERLEPASLKAIKKLIDESCLALNGKIARRAKTLLAQGDRIVICKKESLDRRPKVLFEDEHLLAIDKPIGLVSSLDALKRHFKGDLFLVHRLDKETSGVLLLARSAAAAKSLERQFRERTVHKTYLALVEGEVKQAKGVIENHLEVKSRFQGGVIYGLAKGKGLFAKTAWSLVKRFAGLSLLCCFPHTGRTHQIRVHMKGMGHPIVGDPVYGGKRALESRMCLHAYMIAFEHPILKTQIEIKSSIPDAFKKK